MEQATRRKQLNDFERFKVMRLRKQVRWTMQLAKRSSHSALFCRKASGDFGVAKMSSQCRMKLTFLTGPLRGPQGDRLSQGQRISPKVVHSARLHYTHHGTSKRHKTLYAGIQMIQTYCLAERLANRRMKWLSSRLLVALQMHGPAQGFNVNCLSCVCSRIRNSGNLMKPCSMTIELIEVFVILPKCVVKFQILAIAPSTFPLHRASSCEHLTSNPRENGQPTH